MTNWSSLADEIIREAMAKGEFANLPGEGKPLQLADDAMTPEALRMAHKLLRDNNLAPDWIMDGKELDQARAQLRELLRRGVQAYRGGANKQWARAQQAFRELAQHYNRRVLSYNLRVPPGVAHKPQLDADAEIRRALEAI
ncbi:MAG: DUF1992 domain-containing protein [Chloroflexota bacterium]